MKQSGDALKNRATSVLMVVAIGERFANHTGGSLMKWFVESERRLEMCGIRSGHGRSTTAPLDRGRTSG